MSKKVFCKNIQKLPEYFYEGGLNLKRDFDISIIPTSIRPRCPKVSNWNL
jgi:hypothetical protein